MGANRAKKVTRIPRSGWIQDCQVCNAGLIEAMDALMAGGETIKSASRRLAKQANTHGIQIISAGGIRGRYRYHRQGKTNWEKTASATAFERDLKIFLAHIRTAGNCLKRLNKAMGGVDMTQYRRLMARVPLKEVLKELTKFILANEVGQ